MDELKIRIGEALRIYKDSPNINLTYVDLVRVYEDLLLVLDKIEFTKVGFKDEQNRT